MSGDSELKSTVPVTVSVWLALSSEKFSNTPPVKAPPYSMVTGGVSMNVPPASVASRPTVMDVSSWMDSVRGCIELKSAVPVMVSVMVAGSIVKLANSPPVIDEP